MLYIVNIGEFLVERIQHIHNEETKNLRLKYKKQEVKNIKIGVFVQGSIFGEEVLFTKSRVFEY